eukprot:11500183-Ditylum_brightwellii.AAC.1
MQGKSEYKVCCSKGRQIGDDIQADCTADDSYTWDFYFRNEPVPKKWADLGCCPMHARLCHMSQYLGKEQMQNLGTVKSAVLQRESHADAIVVASCYDQKPFYMVSSVTKEITWTRVTRKVYNSQLKRM